MTVLTNPIAPSGTDAHFRADSGLVSAVRPSPNHGERRGVYGPGKQPDLLILHYTGMPSGRGLSAAERAIRWLTSPQSEVSCHYVVDEDGTITQLVAESRRAWHAGVSSWRGETDINSASIGIEIVNPGHPWDMSGAEFDEAGAAPQVHPGYQDFPEAQIMAVIALAKDIAGRNRMPAAHILAHSDIAPARKSDPGEKFPWARLADAGLGIWTAPAVITEGPSLAAGDEGQPVRALQALLAMFGYGIALTGVYDAPTVAVVTAFQRHWRPALVDGIADRSTLATLDALVRSVSAGGPA